MENSFRQLDRDYFEYKVIRNCVTFIGPDFFSDTFTDAGRERDYRSIFHKRLSQKFESRVKLDFSYDHEFFLNNFKKADKTFLIFAIERLFLDHPPYQNILDLYNKLLKITGPIIVTTQWYNFLELAFLEQNKDFQVYNWCDTRMSFGKDKYTVFQLFGSGGKERNLVVDETDMYQLFAKIEGFPDLFWDAISIRPILFIGYRLNAFFERLYRKIYQAKSNHLNFFITGDNGENIDSDKRDSFERKDMQFIDMGVNEFLGYALQRTMERYEDELQLRNSYNTIQQEAKKLNAFISYSRIDVGIMELVKNWCEEANINAIVDTENVKPGTLSWKESVENYIEQADFVVAILTPNAKASVNILAELRYAKEKEIQIFPLLADGNENTSVPDEFIETVWIDIRNGKFYNINELDKQILNYKKKLRKRLDY